MNAFTLVAALSVSMLTGAAVAQQKSPVATPPAAAKPAVQKPATPPPAVKQPPAPFPEGAKIAYVNLQQVFEESKDGKAARARSDELQNRKLKEIDDKRKQIEANQTLLKSPSLPADKRAALSREVERGNTEITRLQQDAQRELQELQSELQNQFTRRLGPVTQQLAREKGLQMILTINAQTIFWADPSLDLTAELIRRLDAATSAAAPKAPGSTEGPGDRK